MNPFVEVALQFGLSFCATVAFAFMINVPRRTLLICGLAGGIAWLIYWYASKMGTGRVMANFIAAFFIGVFSIYMARKVKVPTIVFNIPALVPLVPGAVAYQAVRFLVLGELNQSIRDFAYVGMVIAAISVGFMIAQLVGQIFVNLQARFTSK